MNTGQFSFDSLERSLSSVTSWDAARNTMVLTFAGMIETIKSHESSIKELELLVSNKPSRHEVKSDLSEKVSFQDLNEKINHLNSVLQAKFIILEDKPNPSEIQKILSDYAKLDDVKKILESKVSAKELSCEVDEVYKQIDKVYTEICESLAKLPNIKDLEFFNQELKSKISIQALEEHLNKHLDPLSKSLKSKSDKSDLIKKADTQDLKSLISLLESKAGSESVEKILTRVEKLEKNDSIFKKRTEKQIKEMAEEFKGNNFEHIDNKINKFTSEFSRHLTDLSKEIRHIQESPSNISELAFIKEKINENTSFFDKEIQELKEKIKGIVASCKNEVSIGKANFRDLATEIIAIQTKSLDQDLRSLRSEHSTLLHSLSSLKETQEQFSAHCSVKLKELSNNYHSNLSDLRTLSAELEKKADQFEIENSMHEMNRKILSSLIDLKEEIQQRLSSINSESHKKTQDFVYKVIEDTLQNISHLKADKKEIEYLLREVKAFNGSLEEVRTELKAEWDFKIEEIRQDYTERFTSVIIELRDKTWTGEMAKLIDNKASVHDVNDILVQLHSEIDEKLNKDEFKRFLDENGVVLNTICAEICIGRWLWKSGGLKDRMVIWDEENTNTNPLLFIWEEGKHYILIEEAGIFELSFAVFCYGKVEILLNSQKLFSFDGNELGCSKMKFVILPSKSKLSVKFFGSAGQGFISLKKL